MLIKTRDGCSLKRKTPAGRNIVIGPKCGVFGINPPFQAVRRKRNMHADVC
jgi:hypothetical protein